MIEVALTPEQAAECERIERARWEIYRPYLALVLAED
jgi:hypothetical protein